MSLGIELRREAVRGALETRLNVGIERDKAVCVYELASNLGIDVRFLGGQTFGGMYCKSSKTILVPSLRPSGRQAFTCAHELGHWYFKHGDMIHGMNVEEGPEDTPQEQLAHTFATYLLMPPWAVKAAFTKRGWNPEKCSPLEIFIAACQLGVGFTTLVNHLHYGLKFIGRAAAKACLRTSPKAIRQAITRSACYNSLLIADKYWTDVPIDICTGDAALLPKHVNIEGRAARIVSEVDAGVLIEAVRPGISRAECTSENWSSFIRVSKKGYEGRAVYRHLEDPDIDE
jgi:hypothetical protein